MLDDLDVRRERLDERVSPWVPSALGAFLVARAAAYADRPFALDASRSPGTGDGVASTDAETAAWAARLARGLVARGIGPGERVALWLPNGAEVVAARFGVALAGAVAVPVNVRLHAGEIAHAPARCSSSRP